MKGSQHKSKDGSNCTRAEKDLSHGFIILQFTLYSITRYKTNRSEVFQMNKLTACQRHQRFQRCKYQTESDIFRAGITLGKFPGAKDVIRFFVSDELYLHIIYGITFDFDNGLIRIDWEHKTEDCIVSPDNQDPKTMTMDTISNFQLECDWIGCSHRETNKVKHLKST